MVIFTFTQVIFYGSNLTFTCIDFLTLYPSLMVMSNHAWPMDCNKKNLRMTVFERSGDLLSLFLNTFVIMCLCVVQLPLPTIHHILNSPLLFRNGLQRGQQCKQARCVVICLCVWGGREVIGLRKRGISWHLIH